MMIRSIGSLLAANQWSRASFHAAIVKFKRSTTAYSVNFLRLGGLMLPFILVGCVGVNGQSPLSTLTQSVLPEDKVVDYRYTDCENIWNMEQPNVRENSLYWLRVMDCADRLSTNEARTDANQIDANHWWQVFQQSILLNAAEPTVAERRKIVDNLNTYSLQFPTAVRPLLQLWREQQVQAINLTEINLRFKRLQQDSDNRIDRLKEQNARLEFELNNVSRKLENLTDIERQLSSRKQTQNIPSAEMEKPATDKPADEQTSLQQPPVETVNPTEDATSTSKE
ncbi:two-component system QseEF-associated lipoprotein QseG [Moellerella wisconsensis]|uniref:Two-component system QseEF-associated lipoprotein QseG n=1 Tax=Moellerella wisconsensis TaxID=158849 RepID=A0ACD3Y6F0_9GAMM|nr:two-component system QseEF-associated lipoprotein QseG [Moellerella wisconsensis]UNH38009.1 two-component system QseEF-associated lipoprotein QseG [Moellerella wisconsensis]UNH41474.1 two-component system QseEF-associated lipoprotein QseG [Moellerella wisconsensis]WJW80970.1 two-component system QseEF-associated lipoprotein QseG [Moellerella wisconsensis]